MDIRACKMMLCVESVTNTAGTFAVQNSFPLTYSWELRKSTAARQCLPRYCTPRPGGKRKQKGSEVQKIKEATPQRLVATGVTVDLYRQQQSSRAVERAYLAEDKADKPKIRACWMNVISIQRSVTARRCWACVTGYIGSERYDRPRHPPRTSLRKHVSERRRSSLRPDAACRSPHIVVAGPRRAAPANNSSYG